MRYFKIIHSLTLFIALLSQAKAASDLPISAQRQRLIEDFFPPELIEECVSEDLELMSKSIKYIKVGAKPRRIQNNRDWYTFPSHQYSIMLKQIGEE
jgi:hypothetical protein